MSEQDHVLESSDPVVSALDYICELVAAKIEEARAQERAEIIAEAEALGQNFARRGQWNGEAEKFLSQLMSIIRKR